MYNLFINIAWSLGIIGIFLCVAIGFSVGFEKDGRPRVLGYQMTKNFQNLMLLVREERIKNDSIKWRILAYTTIAVFSSAILFCIGAILTYFIKTR